MIKRISLIVEGKGDVSAFISLVAKVAAKFGIEFVVVGNPIRAGEARKLRRPGELERFVLLAAGHDVDEIFILLDLDDGCAKHWQAEFRQRAEAALAGTAKQVRLCAFVSVSLKDGFWRVSEICVRDYPNMASIRMPNLQTPRIYVEQRSNYPRPAVERDINR